MLYNDNWNAELFRDMFKDRVRYSKDLGGWFFFDGKVWLRDDNNGIKKHAVDVYKRMCKDLREFEYDPNNETEKEQFENFSKHVKNTGNDQKLNAMIACAQAYLGESSDKFDAQAHLFNCNNKTIDLQKKNTRDFRAEDLLTKISPIDLVQGSDCPQWEKFINDIFLGDQEIIEFVQRAVGYSMTTSVQEHCMFIFYGAGRNGKSTFLGIISEIFGNYSMNCPIATFVTKANPGIPNDIARLKGARLVTSSENNQNVTLDEALIKQLTGGDKITARFLNKEFFDFSPTFKIFISTNHKPNIRGTDPGIWRKIRMIPFNLNVTEGQEDRELPARLRTEMPGILKWVIEGYKKWAETGLRTPQSIAEATNDYQYEEDDVGQFIEDWFILEQDSYVTVNDFKNKFEEVHRYKKSQKTLSEYMARRGFNPKDNRIYLPDGDRVRAYTGLRMKRPEDAHKAGQQARGWDQ